MCFEYVGLFWMLDLCCDVLGWLSQVFELFIGEWDYDVEINRVIGKVQNFILVIIIKIEEKDVGYIMLEIFLEVEEMGLGFVFDYVLWWIIMLFFEFFVDLFDYVVIFEVLCVVIINEFGEIWGG